MYVHIFIYVYIARAIESEGGRGFLICLSINLTKFIAPVKAYEKTKLRGFASYINREGRTISCA